MYSSSVFFFDELNPSVIVMEDSFFSVHKHIVCCYEKKILIGQFSVDFQQQIKALDTTETFGTLPN